MHGAIGEAPEVNRFTLSHQRIPQRHEIPNGGTRPDIFQVRSNGTILATSHKLFKLLFGKVCLRVQFLEVSSIEPSGNGFIDAVSHRVLLERLVFLQGIETSNISSAGGGIQSADGVEATTWTHNV